MEDLWISALTILGVPFLWSGLVLLFVLMARFIFEKFSKVKNALRVNHEIFEKFILFMMVFPAFFALFLLGTKPPAHLNSLSNLPPFVPDLFVDQAWSIQYQIESVSFFQKISNFLTRLSMPLIIWLVYGVGVFLFFFRLITTMIKLDSMARASHQNLSCNKAMAVPIRLCDKPLPPFISPRGDIIIPKTIYNHLDEKQIELIIDHELAHIKRRDPGYFLFLSLVDCVFWFNPFVCKQIKKCRASAELACDSAVVKAKPAYRALYAKTIVDAVKIIGTHFMPGRMAQCVPTMTKQNLKGDYQMRLLSILKNDHEIKRFPVFVLTGIGFVLSALAFPVISGQWAVAQQTNDVYLKGSVGEPNFSVTPLRGKITSSFGPRTHPVTKEQIYHRGTDIRGNLGDPIVAPANGVVRDAKYYRGYGNMMTVDHQNGFVTRYAQLSKFSANIGDKVIAGQVIAEVGSSGQSTGPHLHIEVFKGETRIDPEKVITFEE